MLFLLATNSPAQNKRADSLKAVLAATTRPIQRFDLLNKLEEEFFTAGNGNIDSSACLQMMQIAEQFFGVIALLIVFEFLNLLLHPFLEGVTRHSPLWMLLALVCIAALLVPLHHRLQKIITHKLVEKNKKLRLAASKRAIEQPEVKSE